MSPILPSPRRLLRDARGSVTMIGVLSLSAIVGMTGLAMEAGQGYAEKVENQRIADAAALAAALAYSASSDAAVVLPTARAIAVANGLAVTSVAAPAPTTDAQGRKIITATVTTAVPLYLTRIITTAASYSVTSVGVAAVTPGTSNTSNSGTPGCIVALSTTATTGIAMSGGTSITASSCAVNSNKAIALTGGARLTATQVNSGGAVTYPSGTTLTTTPTASNINQNKTNAAIDPLSANASLTAELNKANSAATFIAPAAIANPTTPTGTDWDFSYSPSASVSAYRTSQYGGDFVVPAGNYTIKRLTIGGGVNVTFQGVSTVTISGGLSNGGSKLNINNGSNWKINGGLDSGSGGIAFANTAVAVGSGTIVLNNTTFGNGNVAMNGDLNMGYGTQTFGTGNHSFTGIILAGGADVTLGAGNLNVTGRITLGGGARLTVGAGNTAIGNVSGNSIDVGGGSTLIFGDGLFSTTGSVVTSSGGNAITFGATANHYIGGNLSLAGSASFGSGAYTVYGDFTNGTGGSMTGTSLSFFLKGAVALGGGSSLNIQAPASNTGEALAEILFATRTATATTLTGGAGTVLAGVWYAPNSAFSMSGGAGISSAGRCFMLIASTITLDGGTAASTSCSSVASTTTTTTTPTTVALIR